jgi:hypothetical protein
MLQVAFDDSGKDGISRSFTLAGYFGTPEELMNLADAWQKLLNKKPRLEYLKGYEAFGLHGQFAGWTEQRRDDRLLEFVSLIAKYSGKGIAFVIDNGPFSLIKELRDDEVNYLKDPNNFAYLMSLSAFLEFLPSFGESVADWS